MEHKSGSPKVAKGQALVEYSMILAFVAVVVVIVLALLGPALNKTYTDVAASLGSPGPTAVPGVVPTPAPTWTFCADEHQYCEFSGTKQVQYGADGTYTVMTFTDGIWCTNDVFGDPLYGTIKHCNIR